MPKSETSNPIDGPSFQAPKYRPNWAVALVCFLLGTWMLVGMVDYDPNQISKLTTSPTGTNIAGVGGAYTAYLAFFSFGLAAWWIPLCLYRVVYLAIRSSKFLNATRAQRDRAVADIG